MNESELALENEPGWLCVCGHWQEDDFHCSCCYHEPPWGCDCSDCYERALERYGELGIEDWYPHPYDLPNFEEVKAQMDEFMLAEGDLVARFLVDQLAPFVEKIEIAGSIRRRRPVIHDVDLVCTPKWREQDVGLPGFGQTQKVNLVAAFLGTGPNWLERITAQGPKIWRVEVRHQGTVMPADIYFATSATWPTLLLIRTGSKEHNVRLCQRARRLWLQLKADGSGLWDERAELFLPVEREADIFRHLRLEYVEPEEREA